MNYGMNPYYGAGAMNSDYLAHHGVKGMKWYHHLPNLPLQSAWKYALGENTIGFLKSAASQLKRAQELEDENKKLREKLTNGTVLSKSNREKIYAQLQANTDRIYDLRDVARTNTNNARVGVKRRLREVANKIRNTPLNVATKLYNAGNSVKTFAQTAGNTVIKNIGEAAKNFKNLITGETRRANAAKNWKDKQAKEKAKELVYYNQTHNMG